MDLITELTGWGRSSTETMSSNTLGPLPKEYDNPSEKVRNTGGDLDDTDTVVKEGTTDMVDKKSKTKPNVVE